MDIFEKVVEAKNGAIPFILATVIDIKGSTPREVGAKMIVWQDGQVDGTIGGGAIEKAVVDQALRLFTQPHAQMFHYDLNELKMQCGGDMTLFLEPVFPKPQLFIFGGGHIGLALARIGEMLNFATAVVDDRPEFANAERFPASRIVLAESYGKALQELQFTDDTYSVIVTYKHLHDQEILEACVAHPFKYLGMIGSKTKVTKSFKILSEKGVKKETMNRIHSPIGLNIGANTPEEIAIAIAAEMVAVRHGAEIESLSKKQ